MEIEYGLGTIVKCGQAFRLSNTGTRHLKPGTRALVL